MTPESLNGITTIAAALLGAFLSGLFGWFLRAKYKDKKELKLVLSKPRNLVDIHDSLNGLIKITVAGSEVETVSSIDYYIVNTGNQVISDINLDIDFGNKTTILGGNCPSKNFNPNDNDEFYVLLGLDNCASINAKYLNPGDEARGHLLLDSMPDEVNVKFRQPGVKFYKVKNYDSARSNMISSVVYEAAKNNFILDAYLKLTLPAYKKYREKNGD